MVKRIVEMPQFTGEARSTYFGEPRIPDAEEDADLPDAVCCTDPWRFQITWVIDKLGTPPPPHVFSSSCFSTTCIEKAPLVDEEYVKHTSIVEQVARIFGNGRSTSSDRIRGSGTCSDGCSVSSIRRARCAVLSRVEFLFVLVHFVAPDC